MQRLRVVPVTAATALRARLAEWPAKVAAPLRDLLERELLRPATAEAVLDAAELAGEPQHVLGFTIAMLEMCRDGVPMLDIIRMAKQIGAPVNLRWSRKRWQSEHARLSRRVTLEQLRADDAVYELATFEALLPDRWPGYLIRTSRRLGLEGLRQDHCVAAYHRRIVDGQCAIATVLLDGKRWTVELRRYGNGVAAELCIAQIAGRYNAPPSRQVHSAILKALGVRRDYHFPTYGNHPEEHAYMDNLRTLLPVLREHGVERVLVDFSGCGDSGQIDDVSYAPESARRAIACAAVESQTVRFAHENGEWRRHVETLTHDIDEAVVHLTEDYLEETGVDYYNNEGGYGHLEINVAAGTVDLEVSQNVEASEVAFARLSDIQTGETILNRVER